MRALSEIYKGIEFVRISSLPEDQKAAIWQSLERDKVIKILKADSLLNDCILYTDYIEWLTQNATVRFVTANREVDAQQILKSA